MGGERPENPELDRLEERAPAPVPRRPKHVREQERRVDDDRADSQEPRLLSDHVIRDQSLNHASQLRHSHSVRPRMAPPGALIAVPCRRHNWGAPRLPRATRTTISEATWGKPARFLAQTIRAKASGLADDRHDPADRWRQRTNRIRARASAGRRRVGADALQPLAITSRTWLTCGSSNSAPGETPRSRKVEPGSTLRRRAVAATAAPAQREEARRQLGRSLARPGSRLATGSTARQTSWRVLDSRRRRPL
jgi:hypothetical protein